MIASLRAAIAIGCSVALGDGVSVFRFRFDVPTHFLFAMAQILDSLKDGSANGSLLCCYVNVASKVQIARVTNIENWYFERVVFPGQRLMFNAPAEAQLEIHTGMMASSILSDSIACSKLVVEAEEPLIEVMSQTEVRSVNEPKSVSQAA